MEEMKITPWKVFLKSEKSFGERICVISNDNAITYTEMKGRINRFSQFIKKYDFYICGIFLPNSSNFIMSMMSLSKLTKIVVPLSFQLKGDSLFERINYADIEVIITNSDGFKEIEKIKEYINIKYVIVIDDSEEYSIHKYLYESKESQFNYNDVFGIFFTSGSTSKPKGVVISNSAITGNAKAVSEFLEFDETDSFLITRSFTQAGPISGDILMPLSCGATIVILGEFYYPAIFLSAVEKYKVTTTLLVSTTLAQLMQYPKINKFDISSLKRIIFGGMTTPVNIIEKALINIPNVNLYNTYGMTEASTKITFLKLDGTKNYKSVGKTIRGCNIKILKEDGQEANVGEVGEIFVNTNYSAIAYYKENELTEKTMTKNGIRTRDMGYRDENGYFYIVGRSDDLIIQGGNNIYPIEIKEVLLRNINIREAEVFGIDDEKLGKKIVAMVCINKESCITSQDIYKWCRNNLEEKKIPKNIFIVDSIPKNSFGKVSNNILIEEIRRFSL